jgi:hypothetical protein
MFHSLIINLIGSNKEVEIASDEISQIYNHHGIKTRMISIQPTCLSYQTTNGIPEWCIQIENELRQNPGIIINKVG